MPDCYQILTWEITFNLPYIDAELLHQFWILLFQDLPGVDPALPYMQDLIIYSNIKNLTAEHCEYSK